jgi:hypothetical protein
MGGGRPGRGLRGEPFQSFRLALPDLDDEPEDFEEDEPDRPEEDDPPDRTEPPEDEPPERGRLKERSEEEDPPERDGEETEAREEPEREEEDGLGRLNADGRETDGNGRESWDAGALIRADGREFEELEEVLRLRDLPEAELTEEPERAAGASLLTVPSRRDTEPPRSFPEGWDRCGSRTVEVRDEPGSCPRERETRPSFPRFPASPPRSGETTAPRRYSVTPFPPRSLELRPLG